MIADTKTINARFNVITQMGLGNLELAAEIRALKVQLDAERQRAERAEKLVRLYESQLMQPVREVSTLSFPIARPEDRVKADADLAKKLNEGWERFDSAYIANPGEPTLHFITLTRVAPIVADPSPQPAKFAAAPVAADMQAHESITTVIDSPQPVKSAAPASPGGTVSGLKVKTVAPSAILEPGDVPTAAPAAPVASESSEPPPARDEAIRNAAKKSFDEALERNRLPAYKPIPSAKPVQENPSP